MAQPLTAWEGDIASLILEMKRRAGVRTDTDLAAFLEINQSTISTWRRRNTVPQQVLLTLEIKLLEREKSQIERPKAAIALAIRVAEFLYQRQVERGSRTGRWLAYDTVAANFVGVLDAVTDNLSALEKKTGRWSMDLAMELIEDERFLSGLAEWIEGKAVSPDHGRVLNKGPQ